MQEMTNRRLRAAWVLVLAVLLLTAGCGEPAPAARRGSAAAASLRGSVLTTGATFGLGLRSWELPSLRLIDLTVNENEWELQSSFGAKWVDRGVALTFAGFGGGNSAAESQLFEFRVDGASRELGQPLSFVSSFTLEERTALAVTCRRRPGTVFVMDVDGDARWRGVARSCAAALSPDGDRVAFVRGKWEIWEQPLDGGPASLMTDLAEDAELTSGPGANVGASALAWGGGGLAIQIGVPGGFDASSRSRLVVLGDDGDLVRVPLEPQSILLQYGAWQPGGDLLAFICRPSSGGALIRLFDPSTREVRVVAADAQFFGDVVWAPDGRSMATNTSNNALLFFDTEGNWIRRASSGGFGVFDWAA
jgi:hypothetical protein